MTNPALSPAVSVNNDDTTSDTFIEVGYPSFVIATNNVECSPLMAYLLTGMINGLPSLRDAMPASIAGTRRQTAEAIRPYLRVLDMRLAISLCLTQPTQAKNTDPEVFAFLNTVLGLITSPTS